MILIEVPKLTLMHEIDELDDLEPNGYREIYAAGAKDALRWIIKGKDSPSEILAKDFDPERKLN